MRADRSLAPDERDQLQGFLKVLANSGSYGVYAEMNRDELGPGKRASVRVYGQGDASETRQRAGRSRGCSASRRSRR